MLLVVDPLVDAIGGFSKASSISPFFIFFIATPLATNSSEIISSLIFAKKKRKKNISMTYFQAVPRNVNELPLRRSRSMSGTHSEGLACWRCIRGQATSRLLFRLVYLGNDEVWDVYHAET